MDTTANVKSLVFTSRAAPERGHPHLARRPHAREPPADKARDPLKTTRYKAVT